MPDSVGEFSHDPGSEPEHFQERHSRATCLPSGLDRKKGGEFATHLHFGVRGIAGQRHDYCALVTDTPINARDTVVGDLYGQLNVVVCDPQPPQMDKSVLVLVPEVVEEPQSKALPPSPGPLWVGLQRLDKCVWAGADAPDLVHPACAAPRLGFFAPLCKVGFADVDGERGARNGLPAPVDAEPVDALVKGGAEVVDDLSEDDCPFDGDFLIEPKPEEVLASMVVYLLGESPWPTLVPSDHFVVEHVEVLTRSRDLGVYPRQGTRVNLQDVIFRPNDIGADPTRA